MIAVYFSKQTSEISVEAIFTGYQKMDSYQSNDFATHMLKVRCPIIPTCVP